MKFDLHVHTNQSIDSIIKPKELIAKSKKTYIIPAISDHNTISAHRIFRSENAPFIPSEEIRTDRGDLIGLFLNECIKKYTAFEEALDKIKEQGAISYLPHMYDLSRKGVIPKEHEISKIQIIEVFNARCLDSNYNELAKEFATKNNKLAALGSDSHFLFEFGKNFNEIAYPESEFEIDNPKKFLNSLKSQKELTLSAVSAPFYVRGTTTMVAVTKKLKNKLLGI